MFVALRNVSCVIKPSSVVVIVGENGSGKSSLSKILTGLRNPTSGQILVDGRDVSQYRQDHIRRAIAYLGQRKDVFPFTFSENIGLGDPSNFGDQDRIREAAALGGALGFIEKYPDGFDSMLDPGQCCLGSRPFPTEGPLFELSKEFENSSDISEGEKQRLAAYGQFLPNLVYRTR